MSSPSNIQPSQAAMPDFHCCGDKSRSALTSAAGSVPVREGSMVARTEFIGNRRWLVGVEYRVAKERWAAESASRWRKHGRRPGQDLADDARRIHAGQLLFQAILVDIQPIVLEP